MFLHPHQFKIPILLINLILLVASLPTPINATENSRQLDQTTTTVPSTSGDEKCAPCGENAPPPPSPPPPALPPPSPPPPSPKKPPSQYCPPPPAPPTPSYIYITGPPGNLYPVDLNLNGAQSSVPNTLPIIISCGLLSLVLFLWQARV